MACESGNYGTAHIYRSSMSAILAFHGSDASLSGK